MKCLRLLALLCALLVPACAQAAITFVGAADGGSNNPGNTNSLSFNYTVGAGTGRLLIVVFAGDIGGGHDDVTGVTFNSVSMTFGAKSTTANVNARFSYLYYLLNPASGQHAVAISTTNNHFILAGAADYAGVNVFDTSAGDTTDAASLSLTTGANNAWVVAVAQQYSSGAGAGWSAARAHDAAFATWSLFDNGPVTPAGQVTFGAYTPLGGLPTEIAMASFTPVASGGSFPGSLSLLGVGQ